MAKTPVHQRQQHHHDKADNASFTTINEGNGASLMTAEMPAHQQGQCHYHNDGKNACVNKCAYPGTDSAAVLLGRM
jgi:hypothetical protein